VQVLKEVNFFLNLEVGVFPFGCVDNLKYYGPFIVVLVLVSCLFGSVLLLTLHLRRMEYFIFKS